MPSPTSALAGIVIFTIITAALPFPARADVGEGMLYGGLIGAGVGLVIGVTYFFIKGKKKPERNRKDQSTVCAPKRLHPLSRHARMILMEMEVQPRPASKLHAMHNASPNGAVFSF